MKTLIIFIALLFPVCSSADWGKSDTARELFFIGTLVVDYRQTTDILSYKNVHESNSLIGSHPGIYFISCAIGHYILSSCLSDKYREAWQVISTLFQLKVIQWNNQTRCLRQNIELEYHVKYTVEF